jgi:hypothetical protein
MKTLQSILILLAVSISSHCFAQLTNQAKIGWYFLAEKATDGILVKGVDSEDVFAIEKNPILSEDDFKNVRMVTRDFEPNDMRAIEMRLTKQAKQKWSNAQERISKTKESVVFVYNDKIYFEKFIYSDNKMLTSYLDLFVEDKYVNEVYEALKK